jgi:hypothetical protein
MPARHLTEGKRVIRRPIARLQWARSGEHQPPFLRAFNGSSSKNFTLSPRCRVQVAGGVTMARVLNEILAYSLMAAFVTGIVVLAAATFIS